MTNEEARSNLEKLSQLSDDGMIDFSTIRESIKVAISALEKQDVPDTNVGDMISRQAAIDAIKTSRYLVDAMEKIIRLPSAQPNLQPTCNKLATVANDICVPCKDSISRQAVTDLFDAWEAAELDHHIPKILRDRLKTIPSVQPEIIHCKDCIRYGRDDCFMKIQMLWELKPDDYCSMAERKE